MGTLLDHHGRAERIARRELYRRCARIGELVIDVAERVVYAVVKQSLTADRHDRRRERRNHLTRRGVGARVTIATGYGHAQRWHVCDRTFTLLVLR